MNHRVSSAGKKQTAMFSKQRQSMSTATSNSKVKKCCVKDLLYPLLEFVTNEKSQFAVLKHSSFNFKAADRAGSIFPKPAADAVWMIGMMARQFHCLIRSLIFALTNVALFASDQLPAEHRDSRSCHQAVEKLDRRRLPTFFRQCGLFRVKYLSTGRIGKDFIFRSETPLFTIPSSRSCSI
jgi:hypothetical protein